MLKNILHYFSSPHNVKRILQRIVGVLMILGLAIVLYATEANPLISGLVAIILYLLITYLIGLLFRIFSFKIVSPADDADNPILRSVSLDFISRIYMPVLICDTDGKIVWYNKALAELFHANEVLYGRYIDQYATATISDIMEDDSLEGHPTGVRPAAHVHFHGHETFDEESASLPREYHVKGYRLQNSDALLPKMTSRSQNKEYLITLWNDKHELYDIRRRMEDQNSIVGYILIDNLDEILQFLQEQYRLASAQVEDILSRWAQSMNGVLKEYERNKFIVVFEARHIPTLIDSRFSVMDEIREVRVGESNMPVTISMGLSHKTGTLAQKEKDAHEALDLALQRGGDQVVYKTENGVEFYGGRTKSVQKRTKVRSRVVAGELANYIAAASNVLIMGHKFADHDSIGSSIGMYQFVRFCGVKANVVINPTDPNIRICLDRFRDREDYEGVFVASTEALDFITSETLLIICDVSNPANFEAPELYENIRQAVIIDHHRKTGEFAYKPLLTYIEPSASSASELVSEMLEQSLPLGTLQKEEADLLLSGILLDTNQFTRNTGVRTFSAALYLRSEGASPADAKMLFRTSLDDFMREARFGTNVIIYRDIIAISMRDGDASTKDDRIAAAKAADRLLSVDGVMASFALVRVDDTIHISARSQGNLNVQLILEKMQGGGHFDVAGAQVKGLSMQSTLEELKTAIDAYLADINQ